MTELHFSSKIKRFSFLLLIVILGAGAASGETGEPDEAEKNGHQLVFEAVNNLESAFREVVDENGADEVSLFNMADRILQALSNQEYCESIGLSANEGAVYSEMLRYACQQWQQKLISDPDSRRMYVIAYMDAIEQLARIHVIQQSPEQ